MRERSVITKFKDKWETTQYVGIVVLTFLVVQAVVVVTHEFTHSFTAWALGCMQNPLGIVWGNPIMMTHWDEGVAYSSLFATGRKTEAAVTAVSPLVMHAITVVVCMFVLRRQYTRDRPWLFHILYWFLTATFMELIAYIFMRPFATHGDTGLFNRGFDISPWFLFVFGSLALIAGLYAFYRSILPLSYEILGCGNKLTQWSTLFLTAFAMFLWGSGIRVMAYVPGYQGLFGLIGIPAFFLILFLFRPGPTA